MTSQFPVRRRKRKAQKAEAPLRHWVSSQPFDPDKQDNITPAQEAYYLASQWQLMWWKLKRHKLAMISAWFLLLMYFVVVFVEVLAPYHQDTRDSSHVYAPPQSLHLFHEGSFVGPFVYGYSQTLDLEQMRRVYVEDPTQVYPIRFLCFGDTYEFWGLFEGSFHVVCPAEDGTMHLMGTDRLGRDLFSRILYGARISLTVGLIGILVSFSLGVVLGGLSGYYGGWTDSAIQRLIEMVRSFPELPLWMALAAALPITWSPIWVFLAISIILGLFDWTGLARSVRSKILSLREEDFAVAARLNGASTGRIVFRHLMPSFSSHLIASATLAIPGMILGETALSFLGLGLRAPVTSWGVLLNEAQNINAVATTPWIMLPVVPVILVVLAFNFLGDGLRDAADPYAN